MNEIFDRAEELGYTIVETTSEGNGYPRNLRKAIVGFETFEEAEEFAKENGLSLYTFYKKAGWQLWYRDYNGPQGPMKISSADYGDDYNHYSVDDLEDFYEEHVKPYLGDFDNFNDVENFLSDMKEVYEELTTIDENQLVISAYGKFYETIDKESMKWVHDSQTWIIGAIEL